jgi:DNA mismatch repair protein MutL
MAGKITVLPSDVVSKIAAGEVVERPASVVKELVENSLDAGATTVEVEARAGGKSFIKVSDDGEGMCREDAVLAFRRHATSKLTEVEGLEEVRSLGFRGEALPSIAAVSRVDLTTSDGSEVTKIVVEDGKMLECEQGARARGTTVVVKDLFFNVPARRKYLSTERSETRRITQAIQSLALARPEVGFTWKHEGRVLLRCPAGQDLATRVAALLGRAAVDGAMEWVWKGGGWKAHAVLGSAQVAGTTRRGQHFFVNGRPVWSLPLREAVEQGYRHSLPEGRFPMVVLHLVSTGGRVDANVHPAKREVRFPKPWTLVSSLAGDIRRELADQGRAAIGGAMAQPPLRPVPGYVSTENIRYFPGTQTELVSLVDQTVPQHRAGAPPVFWQLHKAYILSATKGGLVVIDQHAAHERVLYEEALRRYEGARTTSQQLLFPVLVELPPGQAKALEDEMDNLGRIGLVVKPFGDRSFLTEAVPPGLEDTVDAQFMRDLAADLETARRAAEAGPESLAKIIACHGAVRAGRELSEDEMQSLVDRLFGTTDPQSCPHGRPTFLRISLDELAQKFHRR